MENLETDRLMLRAACPGDAEAVFDYVTENRNFHQPTSPLRQEEFYTLDYQRSQLNKLDDASLLLLIFSKGEDGRNKVIGSISFSQIFYGAFCSCYLGYGMHKDHLRQGLMSEALAVAVNYVFEHKGLHRIQANVMPSNSASIRLLQKLGFRREGLHEDYLEINGQWEDHISFAVINPTFKKQ